MTECAFRVERVERIIDWTPGLAMREQFYCHTDQTTMPEPILVQELAETIALFNREESPPEVRRAVRWFANGVRAELPDDQFQCFFFAIEILAELHKSSECVPDLCPKCRGELFCATCNEISTHRPYSKQAIEQLITRVTRTGGAEAFQLFDTVRNRIMHGKQIDEIEAELPLPFEDIVDRAGRTAWICIMNSLRLPAGQHSPHVTTATTYVHRVLTVKVHANMGGGDPHNPRLEDQGKLTISLLRGERSDDKDPAT